MISSVVLFTTLASLAATSVDAFAVQAIQQGSNCLRVGNNPSSGSAINAGDAVTLGECNNNNLLSATFTGQQWLVTRGNNDGLTLYGTGLCLDAGNDTPNQNIVVNVCNGSPSQTWWATEDNRIAITGGNQCLEGQSGQATTGTCAPGIDSQAFTYNLLFDTETATALVPGAIGTGASRGLISASSSIASAINSLENSASSVIASLTSGAVASASSVINSAQSAASAATASASSVVAGAGAGATSGASAGTGAIGSAVNSATSAIGSAVSSAESGIAGAISSAQSGAAGAASSGASGAAGAASSGASGAAGAASSGANGATSAGGGLVSSLSSVAATITSGAGAAASSITPGNAAVSDFHLSKVALLFSAVAIGAAMVV